MKNLLGEYGKTILYALIAILCIGILLVAVNLIVQVDLFKFKQSTYNSNSFSAEGKPIIECENSTLIVDNSFVYNLNEKGIDYLIDSGIISISNADEYSLSSYVKYLNYENDVTHEETDGELNESSTGVAEPETEIIYVEYGKTNIITVTAKNEKGTAKQVINLVYKESGSLY